MRNLRYADDTTLMTESEEGLKSLLMKVKEESEKVGSVVKSPPAKQETQGLEGPLEKEMATHHCSRLENPRDGGAFTFIKRLFSSSSLSAIRVVSSAYLRLLILLLAILIPSCASSSPAFLMTHTQSPWAFVFLRCGFSCLKSLEHTGRPGSQETVCF